ncbi:NAD(P)/FAD-dependent oxidoreductase [Nonomuraea sp. PA05]|uniref:NAD(P)/FAD-dependent oxidoreductase n=1 Tax=Nonomuraea sp. PA05 TaxID=2604466 RepID=UPI0011DBECD8|nr:FAD-dependent oxidoreductase [Nonomuraea sp. PA05]TYB68863.1 NAD(P)/FAD-dependent oxidoreductase [Nonomuraea sp. PA05]
MRKQILIVGGGYVGMYVAMGLRKLVRSGEVAVTVVDPRGYMTYMPFLAEAVGGSIEPRHVAAPLGQVLKGMRVLTGRVTRVDHEARSAEFQPVQGPARTIAYDILVMAAGSITRALPIPGLAEHAVGFKSIGEAVHLRNRVLAQLAAAASTDDEQIRRRALTFVVVGGGFSGVEALAEMQGLADEAVRYHDGIEPADLSWTLVEANDHILPELHADLGLWTVDALRKRAVDVRLGTRLTSLAGGVAVLSDGTEIDAGTLVWAAGGRPSPLAAASGLPVDRTGRVLATEYLTIQGVEDAFTAGDGAAVPDLTRPGEYTAPNAQHAVRQGKLLGRNLVAYVRGRRLKPYRHAYLGSVAGLGHHQGVAQVYRIKLTGVLGWLAHRAYHLGWVPTARHKAAVLADWLLAGVFRRETVRLEAIEHADEDFRQAVAEGQAAATIHRADATIRPAEVDATVRPAEAVERPGADARQAPAA